VSSVGTAPVHAYVACPFASAVSDLPWRVHRAAGSAGGCDRTRRPALASVSSRGRLRDRRRAHRRTPRQFAAHDATERGYRGAGAARVRCRRRARHVGRADWPTTQSCTQGCCSKSVHLACRLRTHYSLRPCRHSLSAKGSPASGCGYLLSRGWPRLYHSACTAPGADALPLREKMRAMGRAALWADAAYHVRPATSRPSSRLTHSNVSSYPKAASPRSQWWLGTIYLNFDGRWRAGFSPQCGEPGQPPGCRAGIRRLAVRARARSAADRIAAAAPPLAPQSSSSNVRA